MNTQEMLTALMSSKNAKTAKLANKILNKETSIEEELKYEGGFMRHVLTGNFKEAIKIADEENKSALEKLIQ